MPLWGRFADKYANITALRISSFLTFLVPFSWFASYFLFRNYSHLLFFLIIVEFYSGAVFSIFSLSTSNFIYDAVTRKKMALCTAYFNFINGLAIFL